MAATVEGVFRLIDRASGPLRRIEQQAQKTERALHSAGGNLDDIGNRQQLRQLDDTDRRMRNVSRGTQVLDRDLGHVRRTTKGTTSEFHGLAGALRKLAGAFAGLKSILVGAKFVGMLAAVQPLVSAVAALGGGVIALIPKLTDLSGVAAALPATFIGMGLAVGTAKLAFADLGKAMAGNKKAIANLTPEARSFMRTLKQYKPVVDELRKSAQKGLFPGLEYSVRRLQRAVPMLNRLFGRMGRTMGNQARGWSDFLTSPHMLRDLERLGNQGTRVFARISEGAKNLVAALVDIASAARPFTDWLTKQLLKGTENFRKFVHEARTSGRLTEFFDRTRQAVTRFWHILVNLFGVLRGIGHAARPLGDDLWKSFEKITRGWSKWVNSTRGQGDLKAYFEGLRPTLREAAGLLGDVTEALFRMSGPSSQRSTADMLRQLREWVPILEDIFTNASKTYGPLILDAIKEFGRLIKNIVVGTGPLGMFLSAITSVLDGVNTLMEKFPILGKIITAALTLLALNRLWGRVKVVGVEVGNLATKWWGVKAAADAAAISEERAAGMGMMGGRGGPGGGGMLMLPGGRGGPRGGGGGLVDRGLGTGGRAFAATESGLMVPMGARGAVPAVRAGAGLLPTMAAARSAGGMRAGIGAGAKLLGGAGVRGGAGLLAKAGLGLGLRAAGAVGGFALPMMAFSGALGALSTKGTAGERGLGALRGMSMGLWNPAITKEEHRNKATEAVTKTIEGVEGGTSPGALGDIQTRRRLRQLGTARGQEVAKAQVHTRTIGLAGGVPRPGAGPATTTIRTGGVNAVEHATTMKALDAEIKEARKYLHLRQAARKEMLDEKSKTKAKNVLVDLGRAFDVWAKHGGPQKAMGKTVDGALEKIRTMKPAGAKIVAENTLDWAKQQAKHNPKFLKEVDRLQRGIKRAFDKTGKNVQIVNGKILDGSQKQWSAISYAMTSQTETAREQTSKDFTAIQQKAVGALVAMGQSKNMATLLVKGAESGSVSKAAVNQVAAKRTTTTAGASSAGAAGAATTGDGLGRVGGRRPRTGDGKGGGVNLMGANPNLAPYAELGQTYGLSVTSGSRPGAITSSGNVSWHSSGHAVDISGPASGMMSFFNAMKQQYGPGLEELIYTPGGVGIKNGQPFTYTGQVAADHYDHVHVADKDPTGAPAVGGAATAAGAAGGAAAALKMGALQAPGMTVGGLPGMVGQTATGLYAAALTQNINDALAAGGAGAAGAAGATLPSGYTGGVMTFDQVAQLAESVGLPGVTFAQIAHGESGYDPHAIGHDPGGTLGLGLWQITTKYNDDIIAQFGGRDAMFNPQTNAEAAKAIYDRAGIGAWYGTKYMTAPNLHYTGATGVGGGGGQGDGIGDGGGITHRPQTLSVGGSSRPSPPSRGTRAKGGGTMHVHININGGHNVEAQVHRALVKVARELDLVTMEDTNG